MNYLLKNTRSVVSYALTLRLLCWNVVYFTGITDLLVGHYYAVIKDVTLWSKRSSREPNNINKFTAVTKHLRRIKNKQQKEQIELFIIPHKVVYTFTNGLKRSEILLLLLLILMRWTSRSVSVLCGDVSFSAAWSSSGVASTADVRWWWCLLPFWLWRNEKTKI